MDLIEIEIEDDESSPRSNSRGDTTLPSYE